MSGFCNVRLFIYISMFFSSDNYGDCDVNSDYCFSRLPAFLQENDTEILARDSTGTVYR